VRASVQRSLLGLKRAAEEAAALSG
jgi:hypothetical protein